jgi:anti-sigma regulatory factor (Ser/Thr protein kinase)
MEEVESLCLKIRDLLENGDPSLVSFPLELLARECLNNAVLHGSQKNAEKKIALKLWIGRVWLRLQVSDEGPGFNWRKKRGEQKDLDIEATSGRGLLLFAVYAGRVQFNRSGNKITLWVQKKAQTGKERSA